MTKIQLVITCPASPVPPQPPAPRKPFPKPLNSSLAATPAASRGTVAKTRQVEGSALRVGCEGRLYSQFLARIRYLTFSESTYERLSDPRQTDPVSGDEPLPTPLNSSLAAPPASPTPPAPDFQKSGLPGQTSKKLVAVKVNQRSEKWRG